MRGKKPQPQTTPGRLSILEQGRDGKTALQPNQKGREFQGITVGRD